MDNKNQYRIGDRVMVGPSPRGRVLGVGTILALIPEGRPITMYGDTFDNPSLLQRSCMGYVPYHYWEYYLIMA